MPFEDELRRRKRLGDLVGFTGAQETLNRYVAQTWAKTHAVTLAPKTAKHYASLYDLHIEPYLGELKLTELTPEVVGRWPADRVAVGAGRVAVLHALELLGSILQRAVEGGRISRNPVGLVRKIARPRRREVEPLAPATVEAMRAATGPRDAALISVMAYAGLRPPEALALVWGDVRERTLLIQRAASLGQEKDTKTRAHRTVRLLAPLREDLLAWRLRSGRAAEPAVVFPGPNGGLWTKTRTTTGASGAFNRACTTAKIAGATPHALRHGFASLLLHEGRSVVYVARQLGHDPRLTLTTYGHVIDELDEQPHVAAEEAIWAARRTSCVPGVSSETADGDAG